MAVDQAAAGRDRPRDTTPSDPSVQHTDCCIVGSGPAGAVLALLLARQGVYVTLLEAHADFERKFRGNTISPAVMEIMAQIGLAERVLALRHAKVHAFTVQTPDGALPFAEFGQLTTPFPYITMLPQAQFLELITSEAQRYPHFRLVMNGRVESLIEDAGTVRGVRYRSMDGDHELRAALTIGADGRFSKVRRLAGMAAVASAPAIDVLWFNLPRHASDPDGAGARFRFGPGCLLVLMDHFEYWQIGLIIAKGSFPKLRSAGLPHLRHTLASLAPELADRVAELEDWQQTSLLSVESSRVARWSKPGVLLLGDAAHVMSPVGGVGINCAILDAVVAANLLGEPLRQRQITPRHLRAVQRRREWPTRVIQYVQDLAQRTIVARALAVPDTYRLPRMIRWGLRVPRIRWLITLLIAADVWPVRVQQPRVLPAASTVDRVEPARSQEA